MNRRRSRERGNYMVELSLVLVPLMALILAIVDFSMPIFLRSTFIHAVREGARYAITYQTTGALSQSDSIKSVVQRSAAGFLEGSANLSRISVKYYSPTTFQEMTGPGSNRDGNIVEVAVRGYTWSWMAPLWRMTTPLTINVASSDRLEVLPQGSPRPAP